MAIPTSRAGIITKKFEINVKTIPKKRYSLYLYRYLFNLQRGFTKQMTF